MPAGVPAAGVSEYVFLYMPEPGPGLRVSETVGCPGSCGCRLVAPQCQLSMSTTWKFLLNVISSLFDSFTSYWLSSFSIWRIFVPG